jgi:hypothetical protein
MGQRILAWRSLVRSESGRENAKKAGPAWRPVLQYGCPPYARIDSSKFIRKWNFLSSPTSCVPDQVFFFWPYQFG